MPATSGTPSRMRIGLVSDTHGVLDPRVSVALRGVDRIIHAGDVGRAHVLWQLELIAPVSAVAGNVDPADAGGETLPDILQLELAGMTLSVVHVRSELPSLEARESDIVVFGHSHMPLVECVDGVLWVNPGSASQARRSPIGRSVAVLELGDDVEPHASILPLSDFGVAQ